MTATTWRMDSTQSDVLFQAKNTIITYLAGSKNKFDGYINIYNNELEDASIEFSLDVNNNTKLKKQNPKIGIGTFFNINKTPIISFKSTSFQKVNKNISFLKGNLTIQNITKVVELDTEFIGIETQNGITKAHFEVIGKINKNDFGLSNKSINKYGSLSYEKEINLIANLEFTI